MKIAIPITPGAEMSAHFGRSPAFLVLSLEQGRILHREVRANDQAAPGAAQALASSGAHPHDHSRFVRLLGDCQAVVGLGMGAGARQAFESAGVAVRILAAPCPPDEAALRYASGGLEGAPGPACPGHRSLPRT